MKVIELSNGGNVIVDDEDYCELMRWSWHNKGGYAARSARVDGKIKTIRMHRQIMGVSDRKSLIDHKNHDTLDNRRQNLRVCSNEENQRNKRKFDMNTTSKYKGVRYLSANGYYQVRVTSDKITKLIGHYRSEVAGANAYNHEALRLHGEFHLPNDVPFMTEEECDQYRVRKGA